MMIDLNGADIEGVDEVKALTLRDFLEELILGDFLESVNGWKNYKKRIPSRGTAAVTRLRHCSGQFSGPSVPVLVDGVVQDS